MKCTYCQSELPENSAFCTHCGQKIAEVPVTPEAPVTDVLSENQAFFSEAQQDVLNAVGSQSSPKSKKRRWVIAASVAVLVVVAVAAVLIYLSGADGRTVEEAQLLADCEEYQEALLLLDTIEDPSADIRKEMNALKTEIYDGIESRINTLFLNDSAQSALDYLNEFPDIPAYDTLLAEIYARVEDDIYTLMDDGEYIKAQELLLACGFLPNYEAIGSQIMYETFIIQCTFDLRPLMKNPSSLQINSVEFYNTGADYPAVVVNDSGQNGFGGYSNSYVLFDDDDLTYLGSVTTLDTDDLDDVADLLIAYLIISYRGNEDYAVNDAVFDLARINAFLPSGKMPNIDITQYANANSQDENI